MEGGGGVKRPEFHDRIETWWPLPELALRGVFIPCGWLKYVAGWCKCQVCCLARDEETARFLAWRRAA